MSASDPHPTFHLFPNLPPGLRNQIWFDALPTLKPSIHVYHRGCWRHQPLDPSDEGYGLDDGPPISFRLELVKKTWLEVPLVYVNYEARQAALKWGEQHGLPFCSLPNTERLVFLRSFNTKIDALGVPYEEWENLVLFELADLLSGPDLINQTVSPISTIKHFILSERMLKSCVSEIDDLVDAYLGVETLYVIDGEMPELDAASSATGLLQSWEYESSGGKGWRWDSEQRRFAVQENTQIRSPTLYALMEEAARVMTKAYSTDRYEPLVSIVPVNVSRT